MKAVEVRKEKDFMRTDDINYVTIWRSLLHTMAWFKGKVHQPWGCFFTHALSCVQLESEKYNLLNY